MEDAVKTGSLTKEVLKFAIDKVEEIIDEEQKKSHQSISESIQEAFSQLAAKQSLESASISNISVQSGGSYNISTVANTDDLSYDLVYLDASVAFRSLEVSCQRTLIINPKGDLKVSYNHLLDVFQVICTSLQAGAALSQVYTKVRTALQARKPELLKHLISPLGQCGGKFISEDSTSVAAEHDIFQLSIGFEGLPKPSNFLCNSNELTLLIKDSVLVLPSTPARILTEVPREYVEISYSLEDEEEPARHTINVEELQERGVIRSSRLRNRNNNHHLENEKRRKQRQVELRRLKLEEVKARFESQNTDGGNNLNKQRSLAEVRAYPSVDALPSGASKTQIFVDTRHEALLLPIQGQIVPFHVSTIKNVSKNEEGAFFHLRINFLHPGAGVVKDATFTIPEVKHPNSYFIKEMTFRSSNPRNLNMVFKQLKDLIKKVKVKDFAEQEKQSLVDQEKLNLIKSKRPTLSDVTIRPTISGKRTSGTLEGHQNGMRFLSSKGERVDIIYMNVKHAIFQPVESELIVLVHFHLHNPIMIGNKKATDVQFYTEAGVQSDDLDTRRRSGMDIDEIHQEQRERKFKEKLNKEFKAFVEGIQTVSEGNLEFDIPYRDLGFFGVPHKGNVFIMPSVNCLVSLIDQPFFIATLGEIEVVHFERVQFALRNFDMVLIFKNYNKTPTRICSIPAEYLDSVKDWLNDIDIVYSESVNPLNWTNIMKEITKDVIGFVNEGGWDFLQEGESEEGQNEEREEDDVDSEFDGDDEESDEAEDDSEFNDSEDEDDDEDEAPSEDSEEGMDWDELEEHARQHDAKRKNAKLEKEARSSKKPKK